MLTEAELNQMREVAEETMVATAVIESPEFVSDGGGGGTTVWTPAGTVSAHLAPIVLPTVGEKEEGGRITPQADWIVTLPAETTVSTDDRIVIDTTTYSVVAMRAPRTFEVTRRVECKELV